MRTGLLVFEFVNDWTNLRTSYVTLKHVLGGSIKDDFPFADCISLLHGRVQCNSEIQRYVLIFKLYIQLVIGVLLSTCAQNIVKLQGYTGYAGCAG